VGHGSSGRWAVSLAAAAAAAGGGTRLTMPILWNGVTVPTESPLDGMDIVMASFVTLALLNVCP
jgi:hypothetical protein